MEHPLEMGIYRGYVFFNGESIGESLGESLGNLIGICNLYRLFYWGVNLKLQEKFGRLAV